MKEHIELRTPSEIVRSAKIVFRYYPFEVDATAGLIIKESVYFSRRHGAMESKDNIEDHVRRRLHRNLYGALNHPWYQLRAEVLYHLDDVRRHAGLAERLNKFGDLLFKI